MKSNTKANTKNGMVFRSLLVSGSSSLLVPHEPLSQPVPKGPVFRPKTI